MNLNYTLHTLTQVVGGTLYGDKDYTIQNIVTDSRSPIINQKSLFIALKGNKVNGLNYCEAFINKGGQTILVTQYLPQLKGNQIVVDDTLKALQQLAIYHRQQFNIPVIGITGSNGKTTVKEWLYHTLKDQFNICRSPKSYNSQLGVALSVLELTKNHTLGLFEAGISQPNEMDVLQQMIKPTVGVFTGIGDAHQQNFKTVEDKQNEKFKLFNSVDTIIQNGSVLASFEIPFKDVASQKNANLVYQCALEFGVDKDIIIQKLKTLPPISMRMEKMEGKNDNIIINDAYSLDEKSLEIGIQYLNQSNANKSKVLIIGPHENSHFSNQMVDLLNSLRDTSIYLIGQSNSYLKNLTQQFKSVADFISQGIQIQNATVLITGSRASHLEQLIPFFTSKKHITKLTIDLSAVRNNLNFYQSKLKPSTQILAMVKAQSYGGGIVEMAQFLQAEKVNYFGVAYADEGVILRQNGIDLPILVMNPEPDAFDDMIQNQLEPSIYSLVLLDQFIGALISQNKTNFPIHLKLDTGMNRLGFVESDLPELIAQINAQPEVYVKSVFSHLAVADNEEENEFTNYQIEEFKTFNKRLEKGLGYEFMKHISNSAGALHFPDAQFDIVRLGIGLFGLLDEQNSHLEPVLSFKTQISQIKTLKKGDSVGYGRTFMANSATTIAVIPVGYADGLRRDLSQGKWDVFIGDQPAKIIGNICMDMCMVDITNLNCKVGDSVDIFGPHNSVFKMSKTLNTIPYEIISTISSRVHRVYVEE